MKNLKSNVRGEHLIADAVYAVYSWDIKNNFAPKIINKGRGDIDAGLGRSGENNFAPSFRPGLNLESAL